MKKIIEFQKAKGLVADGIIGKATLAKMRQSFGLNNDIHLAHFLGQIHHETGFNTDTENTNYSVERMLLIHKSDFDINKDKVISAKEKEKAISIVGNPKAIANFIYANQNGNGNEASGDGWKYRGRGAIQLTGKANYLAFQKWLNLRELNPDDVAIKYYWQTALFFFETNGIFKLCNDVSDATITKVSKKINGGTNGLSDRIAKTKYYYNLITK